MLVIGRIGSTPHLVLEANSGAFDDLVTIKTGGRYRCEIIEKTRRNLESWMKNPDFKDVRNSLLDLAIVARVSPDRMKNQDIDNIAKVVMDALKESDGDSRFLFHDDRQVVRILVWKIQREERAEYNTDSLTISFRVHDDRRQMVLVEPSVM